jgi:hypothetical protein
MTHFCEIDEFIGTSFLKEEIYIPGMIFGVKNCNSTLIFAVKICICILIFGVKNCNSTLIFTVKICIMYICCKERLAINF